MSLGDLVSLAAIGVVGWLGYQYIQKQPAASPSGQAAAQPASTVYYITQPAAQQQVSQGSPQVVYVQSAQAAPQTQQGYEQAQVAAQYASNYGNWLPDLSTNATPGAASGTPANGDWLGCA